MTFITGWGTVEVKGAKEAEKVLDEIIAGIDRITEETLEQLGPATIDLVKSRTPIRTGRLISNHEFRVIDGRTLRFWNEVQYAAFVEFGTSKMMPRPHWRPAIERLKRRLPEVFGSKGADLVSDSIARNT